MFHDLRSTYHWILDTFRYRNIPHLLTSLENHIIQPVEEKIKHWEPEKEKIREQEEKIKELEAKIRDLEQRKYHISK